MQLKSYKFRLYPTEEQKQTLAQYFGAKRWIFNHYLHDQKHRFLNKQNHLSNFDINKDITRLKKIPDTAWLKEVDDWCLKHAAEDLATAYQNFFNSITGKSKQKAKNPKFKKYNSRQSYRTRGVKIDFANGMVKLPKIKNIKAVIHRSFTGTIKSSTISKDPNNQYYISILVEEEATILPKAGREIGIDLGIKDLLILSNGTKFNHPKQMLEKANRSLKKAQKKFSRKTKDSKNHYKQRIKVGRAYAKVTKIRNAYYHDISAYLVRNFDSIYMENLNVKGMLQNRTLSRAIHSSAWSTLSTMIQYKCSFYGRTFYKINRFAPSSKTCSCCNHKLDKLLLSVREWTCPQCLTHHDRDLNAAQNIKNFGQLDIYDQIIPSDATTEEGIKIPMALMKHTSKIERSSVVQDVSVRIEQAHASL